MMFRRECSKETEGDEIDFLPLLLLLLLLFVSTFLRFVGGTSRARYIMSRDDLDTKRRHRWSKKRREKNS